MRILLFCSFLGAKFRKATTNFVMSVRLRGTTPLPLDGFSLNLTFESFFFRKSVENFIKI